MPEIIPIQTESHKVALIETSFFFFLDLFFLLSNRFSLLDLVGLVARRKRGTTSARLTTSFKRFTPTILFWSCDRSESATIIISPRSFIRLPNFAATRALPTSSKIRDAQRSQKS